MCVCLCMWFEFAKNFVYVYMRKQFQRLIRTEREVNNVYR